MFALGCSQPQWGDAAPPSERPEYADRLDAWIGGFVDRFALPGLAVAVTTGDEIAYVGTWGVRNLEGREPIVPESLFHMASVSKPFVATAIVQLVERGLIDLDEPVTTYLPYFTLDDERAQAITIRQMLNHTSGMPDVDDYEWATPQLDAGAAERLVRSLGDRQLLFEPGKEMRYSNLAYDTLGDVIAKVSGVSFEDYTRRQILEPLGMEESSFFQPETREDLRTSGHVWRGRPRVSDVYPYNRRHAPSSTLNSNVIEMTRWARANLNLGELEGTRILESDSYRLLFEPSHEIDDENAIGLSWFLREHRGHRTISHSGGDTGYSSYLLLLPDDDLAVVLACNYDASEMGALYRGILDMVLGYEPDHPVPSILSAVAPVLQEGGLDAARARYLELQESAPQDYRWGENELNILARYWMQRDDRRSALDTVALNLELFPESASTHYTQGRVRAHFGERDAAISAYRRALELDPSHGGAAEHLERLGREVR